MDEQTLINDIMNTVVASYGYLRMQNQGCRGVEIETSYEKFLDWNRTCINALPNNERIWLHELCSKLTDSRINLMDLESCATFTGEGIYFDLNKRLCIFNGR